MNKHLPLLALTLLLAACMPTASSDPDASSSWSSVAVVSSASSVSSINAQDMVELTSPAANATVTSPLTLSGRARGPWYFEASFPVDIRDASDTVIAQHYAEAQGDWMTTDWVPFTSTVTFPAQPAGSVGFIVLKKDNPSGLPEYDASVVVPVQF